jgi:hypothetical protein
LERLPLGRLGWTTLANGFPIGSTRSFRTFVLLTSLPARMVNGSPES